MVDGDQSLLPDKDDPNGRGLSRKHILRRSTPRSAAWAWTTSISTRSTASTPTRRLRRRSRRCTTSSGPGRPAISARRACSPGSSRGCSTRSAHGWTQFVSMQNHYNLVYREEEREMNPFCLAEGIGLIPWSPLARGFLAGNRKRGGKTRRCATARHLGPHALLHRRRLRGRRSRRRGGDAQGVLPIQVALAWILRQARVTAPIISVTKLEQLEQLVVACESRCHPKRSWRSKSPTFPHKVIGIV